MTHSDQLSQAIKGAAEVRAWGPREAHPRPRVGERDDGGPDGPFKSRIDGGMEVQKATALSGLLLPEDDWPACS